MVYYINDFKMFGDLVSISDNLTDVSTLTLQERNISIIKVDNVNLTNYHSDWIPSSMLFLTPVNTMW